MKRLFDIIFSFIGIVILLPVFLVISIIILLDSRGGIFYFQSRVGKNNRDFKITKFRTMKINSEEQGLLTVGIKDDRITKAGVFLRKHKLDELPQLFNVFIGDMSIVGPRPEVRKYVDLYDDEQKKVLSLKPGMTDYASIIYINENEILGKSENPEQIYINIIMPHKLDLNLHYLEKRGMFTDLQIICKTIKRLIL